MSFSLSFNVVDGEQADNFAYSGTSTSEEHIQMSKFGEAIAMAIVSSGVVGTSDKRFNVVVSGHGNPNHEPLSGWSNDYIQIQVTQM